LIAGATAAASRATVPVYSRKHAIGNDEMPLRTAISRLVMVGQLMLNVGSVTLAQVSHGSAAGTRFLHNRRMKTLNISDLDALVGQEVAVSPWLEITQDRIDQFAKATEDFQWIHVDRERAAQSPFGGTIAHGFLTLSMLPRLTESSFTLADRTMGVNYGLNKVRFTAPVAAGSRIRGRFTLARLDKLDGGVQTTWNVVIEREGTDKPVMIAESISRHYR
jgi:acyl dehydratase